MKAFYLAAARGLTLARLASIPIFLVLLTHAHGEARPVWRLSLLLLYVGIALSDVFDGRLARKAGAPSHAWGEVERRSAAGGSRHKASRHAKSICRKGPSPASRSR